MSKRKYTKRKHLLPVIEAMLAEGKSHREIELALGLEGERPVHDILKKQRRKERKQLAGEMPKPKGRPRKDGQPHRQDIQKELERLRMENKLLRDFLRSTGRK